MFKLNEKQQQALDLDSYQNVLVLAPPGSGKTSLLEQKIIKFVKEDVRYVALTFSKKSSQELSDRVSIALKNDALQRYAHTFHSYCYSLLKIYDDTFDADSFDFTSSDSFDFLITRATDLINSNVIPLSENLVFLIDEFQDTDKTQLNFMLALSDNHNTKFFVVGDPNQSIYSFRGAEVSNILNFEQQFSAVKVELNINYRSHKSIVDFSNYLIKHSSENISETDSVSFNTDTTFTRPIHCRYQN